MKNEDYALRALSGGESTGLSKTLYCSPYSFGLILPERKAVRSFEHHSFSSRHKGGCHRRAFPLELNQEEAGVFVYSKEVCIPTKLTLTG